MIWVIPWEKEIYQPLEIKGVKKRWKGWFFSKTNTGLLLKQILFKKYLLQDATSTDYMDDKINLAILNDLIVTVKHNRSSLIFFCERDSEYLPPAIQRLINASKGYVYYVNSREALEKHFTIAGVERSSVINHTNHYNARGNQLYAEAVFEILKSREWGQADRRFKYNPVANSFENISIKW